MYYKKSELITTHWPLLQILSCTVHVNTWGPRTASLPWLTEHRQHIQMGPKTVPAAQKHRDPVSNPCVRSPVQGGAQESFLTSTRHWVMGRRDLSENDRPRRKALGECACTGVRQDTQESDTITDPEKGISGRQCENPLRIWPYLRKSHAWLLFFPLLGLFVHESSLCYHDSWKHAA